MIVANNLTKDYGSFRAVDSVSFTIGKGEVLGFLGPNGAGKSTTMKMVTGFLKPSSGSASVGGYDIIENPIAAKRLLGYLPESGPLYHEMTVLEFLNFISDIRGLSGTEGDKAIHRVFSVCNLEGVRNQTIETLSKGYRQRVGLAQAILHDPECMILDEPTDGLDPNQKKEVRDLIASMADEKSIILSTHILEEVEAMCTRVIVIAAGKLVVDEKPTDLLRRHPLHNVCRVRLESDLQSDAQNLFSSIKGVKSVDIKGDSILVYPQNHQNLESEILNSISEKKWILKSIGTEPTPLQEVFWRLTKDLERS